jgi:hypothetical protein
LPAVCLVVFICCITRGCLLFARFFLWALWSRFFEEKNVLASSFCFLSVNCPRLPTSVDGLDCRCPRHQRRAADEKERMSAAFSACCAKCSAHAHTAHTTPHFSKGKIVRHGMSPPKSSSMICVPAAQERPSLSLLFSLIASRQSRPSLASTPKSRTPRPPPSPEFELHLVCVCVPEVRQSS